MSPYFAGSKTETQRGVFILGLLSRLVVEPLEKFNCSSSELPNTRKEPSPILNSPTHSQPLGALAMTFKFSRAIPVREATPSPFGAALKALPFLWGLTHWVLSI